MKRPNPWAKEMRYPKPVKSRIGCKVSWNYYQTEGEAETCAKAARHNAEIAESLGYDFGYQSPGFIRQVSAEDWPEYGGLWEVCLP